MEEIINKYKDDDGYVSNLELLRKELETIISKKETSLYIKEVYEKNIEIYKEKERENFRLKKLKELKERKIELLDYIQEKQNVLKKSNRNNSKEYDDVSFYIDFIETSLDSEVYLSILPRSTKKEDILVLDRIISYYIKEINTFKYFLSTDIDDETLMMLDNSVNIYNTLINYKEELFSVKEDNDTKENDIVYYMNDNETYLYNDVVDNPESYESIKLLLDSIKNGRFRDVKHFSDNNKTRGLLQVRDLSNRTRLLFTVVGYRKYCIIGAVIGKKETNTIYKERIVNRYTKYKNEKENISSDKKSLSKIFRGENNE